MSLRTQQSIPPVPDDTVRVARAAFRQGNPYMLLHDQLGAVFADGDFADLYPALGQPAYPPGRLALVTLMRFREGLSDRQAAEAVRARIDWKYLLGLELSDPGFNFSVLSEFRDRLLAAQPAGTRGGNPAGCPEQLRSGAPGLARAFAAPEWHERYGRRVENARLPRAETQRRVLLRQVGEDGVRLLQSLDHPEVPADLQVLLRYS